MYSELILIPSMFLCFRGSVLDDVRDIEGEIKVRIM